MVTLGLYEDTQPGCSVGALTKERVPGPFPSSFLVLLSKDRPPGRISLWDDENLFTKDNCE